MESKGGLRGGYGFGWCVCCWWVGWQGGRTGCSQGALMYVDFVYWHLILVTPDGHTFVCAVLPDLSA